MPPIHLHKQNAIKGMSIHTFIQYIVHHYLKKQYTDKIIVFTDGTKDLGSGCTGAAVFIPQLKIIIKKRTSNNLSVYTVELVAIILGLWVEENSQMNSYCIRYHHL